MKIDANSLKGKGPLIVSVIGISLLILTITSLFFYQSPQEEIIEEEEEMVEEPIDTAPNFSYGVQVDTLSVEESVVGNGRTLSTLLGQYGLTATEIHNLVEISKGIFDVRSMKSVSTYTAILSKDETPKLLYFIYDVDAVEYVKYTLVDTLMIERIKKPIENKRKTLNVIITSSLWESIISAGGSPSLVSNIEDIFQWTVDFYGIKQGDSFSFIVDESFVEGKSIGIGNIIGASYRQKGKSKYAFRYEKDGKAGYWDEEGMSLRRAFLKAPLRFSRISSKFTYRRLHPISKVYKAHTGVDYAAPMGTPVQAVADGVVVDKFFNAGGGNTLKIKHYVNKGAYMTGYLHLRGYAKGVNKGSRVSQGQVIAYVGSTGGSTGPHLDFRVWKNGKPIDPLKMGNQSGDPLNDMERALYKEAIKEHLTTIKAVEEGAEEELSDAKWNEINKNRAIQEKEEEIQNSVIQTVEDHDVL